LVYEKVVPLKLTLKEISVPPLFGEIIPVKLLRVMPAPIVPVIVKVPVPVPSLGGDNTTLTLVVVF